MRVVDTAAAWHAFGVRLFAFTLPLGAAFLLVAPLWFMRVLGAIVLFGSALGFAASMAGLRIESPAEWRAFRREIRRRLFPPGMSRDAS